jgi:hypothetical protein
VATRSAPVNPGNVVQVGLASNADHRRTTDSAGLTLVPTLFSLHATAPISADEPPVVMYGARGAGALWATESPVTGQALPA